MIKKLVHRFIKIFRKQSFEDSVIEIITLQLVEYDMSNPKTLLPVVFASVNGITVTRAVRKLKRKGFEIYSNRKILGEISNLDKESISEITDGTREVIFRVAKKMGFAKRKTTVSIDFHDKPFYGNRNIKEVVGTKQKLGTNFAYSYATICICEEGIRFNLATIPVTQLNIKKNVIEYLINEARRYVSIGLVLLDRGFNGVDTARLLDELRAKYVMPLTDNSKLKKICSTKRKLIVIPYTYREDRPKEYQKQIKVIVDNRGDEKHLFTTNIPGDKRAVLSQIIATYRKRWGIETGYRVAGEFYAWTTSVKFSTRTFLSQLSFLLQDLWTLFNFILQAGTKFQQPRNKILKGCKKIFDYIIGSNKELNFYWRPSLEADLFREDIADCVKNRLA
jgi:hypothetical protein